MPLPRRGGDFRLKNVFGRKICQNLPMRSGILFTSIEVVHRPKSKSLLHFCIRNLWQIHTEKHFPSAPRLLPAALIERWLQVCRVKIKFDDNDDCLYYH